MICAFLNKEMKKYKQSKLANSLTLISCEDKNAEVVVFLFSVKAGSRYEAKEESGLAHLLEHMMLRGTTNRPTAFEISLATDRAGAYINARTSAEKIDFIIEVSKEKAKEMFELLADILLHPLFDGPTLENEKKVIVQELHQIKNDPPRNLWWAVIPKILKGHPLGNHVFGTEDSIVTATPEKLKNYHQKFFTPSQTAIIASGAISHAELETFSQILEHWNNKNEKTLKNTYSIPISRNRVFFEKKSDAKQSFLDLFFLTKALSLREMVTLHCISTFLNYGHSSLLYQELRHKLGLVYSVSTYQAQYSDACVFYTQAFTTEPEKVIRVLKEKILNLEKYFSRELLEEIKKQQINIMARGLSSPYNIATQLATHWNLYDRLITPAEIQKLTEEITYEDIVKVKNSFLNEKNLSIGVLGEKEIAFS